MEGPAGDAERWVVVRDAIVADDLDEAARLIMHTPLLPGLRRQLQGTFQRLPVDYIDDALAEAVAETFVRLQGGKPVDPSKVGGYIFNAAKNIATDISEDLKHRHLFFDADTTPYDPELAATHGLGELVEDPDNRLAALQYLAEVIDLLPSSDNPKAVLKVRIAGAVEGEWLTDAEVAELLGREKSSISSWWRRGLIDLRQHLADRGISRESLRELVDELDQIGEETETEKVDLEGEDETIDEQEEDQDDD